MLGGSEFTQKRMLSSRTWGSAWLPWGGKPHIGEGIQKRKRTLVCHFPVTHPTLGHTASGEQTGTVVTQPPPTAESQLCIFSGMFGCSVIIC